MIRYTSLKKYKKDLLRELGPIDNEVRFQAVFDSEEHLSLMVEEIMENEKNIRMKEAVHKAVVSFGYPSEIAEAYRMVL